MRGPTGSECEGTSSGKKAKVFGRRHLRSFGTPWERLNGCFGKTMQTFLDSRQLAWDKVLDREAPATARLLILFVRSSPG